MSLFLSIPEDILTARQQSSQHIYQSKREPRGSVIRISLMNLEEDESKTNRVTGFGGSRQNLWLF